MDRLIYLFGALLMSGGIVVLLGTTPEVMTQDIMSLLSRQRSLKYLVAKAQGKVRRSRLQQAVMNVRNALSATHSENKFSLLISVSEYAPDFCWRLCSRICYLYPYFRVYAWCFRMRM